MAISQSSLTTSAALPLDDPPAEDEEQLSEGTDGQFMIPEPELAPTPEPEPEPEPEDLSIPAFLRNRLKKKK